MKISRIQHIKDVIFTRETLQSKDQAIPLSHSEINELFDCYGEYNKLKDAFLTLMDCVIEANEAMGVNPSAIKQIKEFHMNNAGL